MLRFYLKVHNVLLFCLIFIAERLTVGKKSSRSSSSGNSTISTREIQAIIDKLRNSKYRATTERNYQCVWICFNKFFVRLDRKPTNWEDRLVLFVGFLVEEQKQSSTIRSYILAIRAVLLDNDIELNENQYLLKSLTKACKIVNDKIRHRFPIRKSLVMVILYQIDLLYATQPYLNILFKTLISTAYFGLFRVGELTHSGAGHVVRASNVHIGLIKNKVLFILHTSKTHDKSSRPQKIKITSKPVGSETNASIYGGTLCPYQLIREYLNVRKGYNSQEEQFFVYANSSPVKAETLRSVLRSSLKTLGFNCKLYGMHSLQAGRALDLIKFGLSVETVKDLGRSNAVFTYLKE